MERLAICFVICLNLAANVKKVNAQRGFLGNLLTNVAQGALQELQQKQQMLAQTAAQPSMPSVAEQERIEASGLIQAIQRAKMNQISATEAHAAVKDVQDTYKQLEQDLAMPLAEKTSHLKAERLKLMRRISTLTREVRSSYDSIHPDMVNSPLIIVAKTPEDDMRAVANRIDAQGSLDDLQGIMSPCAQFHNEREAQKKELQVVQSMNNLDEEARALSRMSPEERLTYVFISVTYPTAQVELSRTEKQAGTYRPTVLESAMSGLIGGALGSLAGGGVSPFAAGRV
ncbi:hypothetical protein BESB_045270 [Besnoitia besnoiti]|uniref:Transmembrane protein n=1 Tax=Besnoitia besnoiti TaxID=94643 RepID=A0A2A9MEC8_BESBE|nr:hypothetical protein BESB_045270 [Besnoitia besnoiti]PFH36335.1 hypothetical protein BESB_045270 [Besnoitia besnoiti]